MRTSKAGDFCFELYFEFDFLSSVIKLFSPIYGEGESSYSFLTVSDEFKIPPWHFLSVQCYTHKSQLNTLHKNIKTDCRGYDD